MLKRSSQELVTRLLHETEGWLADIVATDPNIVMEGLIDSLGRGEHELYYCYGLDNRCIGIVTLMVRGDTLCLDGAAGDVMGEWEQLDEGFVSLCKDKGCTSYEFRGRRGFLRAFKSYGMTEKYTVMTRPI
jgi:hypothetical protein